MTAAGARPRWLASSRALMAIAVGGAVGTMLRAALSELFEVTLRADEPWPWSTFIANLAAALVLGYVTVRLASSALPKTLLGTGLCGGLSTFSHIQMEIVGMLQARDAGLAAAYALVSIAAGLGAVWLGMVLARRPAARARHARGGDIR